MEFQRVTNWWARQSRSGRIHQSIMLLLAAGIVFAPHGTAQGRNVYLGDPHHNHLYPPEWDSTHEWYSRSCVVFMCAMAYTSGLVRQKVAYAKTARAVVTLTAPFLLVLGLQSTRMAEMHTTESTHVGLWLLVPYTYTALA